ncbi:MAG: rhomboid family intramembrane serine protease [Terriglobia bacterium]
MSEPPILIATLPPERLVIHRRYQPIATFVILGLNILLFALMTLSGGSKSPDVLLNFGASYGPFIQRGEYWRLVMPMFLHIGFLHLALNSLGLVVLGRILESVYGYGRFTFLYVACGIGSSFLSMRFSPAVAAGASGAIFGIAGAMLTIGYLHRAAVPRHWRRSFGGGILPLILINLAFGYSIRGIDNWGHLGGLITGILLSAVLAPPGIEWIPGAEEVRPSQAAVVVPIVIVALAMVAGIRHYQTSRVVARLLSESLRLRTAGKPDEALQRIREAFRVAPSDERPHEELGALYLSENRVVDAIREYQEARRLSPISSRAQLGLSRAYRRQGDLAKARKLIEELVGEELETANGQRAIADLYNEERLYEDAIRHYQTALKMDPNDAVAHNNLGWLYATCGDEKFRNPASALEHAKRAVDLSRWKEPAFVDTLAEAFYVNGNFSEAVRTQELTLKLDPDNKEYQEHMARYRKAGAS